MPHRALAARVLWRDHTAVGSPLGQRFQSPLDRTALVSLFFGIELSVRALLRPFRLVPSRRHIIVVVARVIDGDVHHRLRLFNLARRTPVEPPPCVRQSPAYPTPGGIGRATASTPSP